MNVNVHIQITDDHRDQLANLLDGKTTKRLATRAEIGSLCRLFIESLIDGPATQQVENPQTASERSRPLEIADLEDAELLAGKAPCYIRGWNTVKQRMASRV